MNCPNCGHTVTAVTDTRAYPRYLRRRRQCGVCSLKWTTVELAVVRSSKGAVPTGALVLELLAELSRPALTTIIERAAHLLNGKD